VAEDLSHIKNEWPRTEVDAILTHSIAPMKLSGLQLREFRYANANNVRRIKLHRYRFKKNDEFVLKL